MCREQWLAAAQKVFQSLDSQSDGLTMERLMRVLREKLPAAEVEYAVEDALVDAGYKGKLISDGRSPAAEHHHLQNHCQAPWCAFTSQVL